MAILTAEEWIERLHLDQVSGYDYEDDYDAYPEMDCE